MPPSAYTTRRTRQNNEMADIALRGLLASAPSSDVLLLGLERLADLVVAPETRVRLMLHSFSFLCSASRSPCFVTLSRLKRATLFLKACEGYGWHHEVAPFFSDSWYRTTFTNTLNTVRHNLSPAVKSSSSCAEDIHAFLSTLERLFSEKATTRKTRQSWKMAPLVPRLLEELNLPLLEALGHDPTPFGLPPLSQKVLLEHVKKGLSLLFRKRKGTSLERPEAHGIALFKALHALYPTVLTPRVWCVLEERLLKEGVFQQSQERALLLSLLSGAKCAHEAHVLAQCLTSSSPVSTPRRPRL